MEEVMGELPFSICNSIKLSDVKTYMFYVICVYLRNIQAEKLGIG